MTAPLLSGVDAVTVPVPDLDAGIAFYRDRLGHPLLWRNDELGQAGLGLTTRGTEIVLSTRQPYAPTWLVDSADEAATAVVAARRTPPGRAVRHPGRAPGRRGGRLRQRARARRPVPRPVRHGRGRHRARSALSCLRG